MIRVLGVDPGSRKTGWGVVESTGRRMRGVSAGIIRLNAKVPLADRLEIIYDRLDALIDEYAPDAVAVEDVFFAKYASAAIKLGHVRGVVLLLVAKRGLPLGEYPPALVKRAVAGRGAADKSQLGRMVCAMLGLDEQLGEDATDALAVAVAHLSASRRAPTRSSAERSRNER